jgi:glycosyltransferase involved in cell wall biosynthesis
VAVVLVWLEFNLLAFIVILGKYFLEEFYGKTYLPHQRGQGGKKQRPQGGSMTIVFVVDNYGHLTNGTTMSARRFREELERRGHMVRVASNMNEEGEGLYCLRERRIPLVSRVAARNDMRFARFDEETVRAAFTGADVVHLFFPFQLQKKCSALARRMGIPVTATFHCQGENITYNIHLERLGFLNALVYWWFNLNFYRKVDHIHCPSAFAAGELKQRRYKAALHVISNGAAEVFRPPAVEPEPDAALHLLMTGRLSAEKRQEVVIKAVNNSRYRSRIQLHFVGRGPRERYYRRLGAGLPLPPDFRTVIIPQEELVALIQGSCLYVHTSEVELESLACLEALACGVVPVIAAAKKSAAPQFALDERSLFRPGDWRDLWDRIDYWLDNPAERRRMGREYARLGERYRISTSARLMEEMFSQANSQSSLEMHEKTHFFNKKR